MDEHYGPALPPHMMKNKEKSKFENDFSSSEEEIGEDDFCPALPPHLLKKFKHEGNCSSKEQPNNKISLSAKRNSDDLLCKIDENEYGAALPPHLLKKKDNETKRVIGPALPANFCSLTSEPVDVPSDSESDESEEDDDGLLIGPVPSNKRFDEKQYKIEQFEQRARKMKDKLTKKVRIILHSIL